MAVSGMSERPKASPRPGDGRKENSCSAGLAGTTAEVLGDG
jgi:hypothetical protein